MIPERAFKKLEALYGELAGELPSVGGVCTACGECCHFDRMDHELYATRLEIEYMKQCGRPPDWSRGPDVCPFLSPEGKCGARAHRPLGCRTYFRVIGDRPGAEALYEKYLRGIREICREEGGEYTRVLAVLQSEGTRPWPSLSV